MTGTLILSGAYQWLAKVEDAPFGSREVRKLLIARGVGGFFGVYGMYCKLQRYSQDSQNSLIEDHRLTPISTNVRCNGHYFPRANRCLLGLFDSNP